MQWFIDIRGIGLVPVGPPRWGKAKPLDLWARPADEIRDELRCLAEAGSGGVYLNPKGAEQISEQFGTRREIVHTLHIEGEAIGEENTSDHRARHLDDEEAQS
ncbi:hypothetical protein [Nocardia seriolae]|uniref:hypothetical protein n=1 Tax=Nocardia seriolae TaxID=37332 RepID=UPI00090A0E11|nr:hypothetical protein [Nocardia seriolae]MTJ65128.1 hypothetical protein [Nocardia seriolae]MTJ71226.1 hypothetical protein [Nocardia seriolae]MTJ86948.1 hypothetical protein [Nocardia seriolae]MTK30943.1 hypothetical protein [Nocardia seriolae]MTK43082.1 hypothetical protein [Nocardia seriolae]